jgi:hypothetical protein
MGVKGDSYSIFNEVLVTSGYNVGLFDWPSLISWKNEGECDIYIWISRTDFTNSIILVKYIFRLFILKSFIVNHILAYDFLFGLF